MALSMPTTDVESIWKDAVARSLLTSTIRKIFHEFIEWAIIVVYSLTIHWCDR